MSDLEKQQEMPVVDDPSAVPPENPAAAPGQQPDADAGQATPTEQPPPANVPAPDSWSSLPPEYEQLVRLAPLPADRETGLRPLLFGSFGRVEKHSKSKSMLKLSVNFPGYKPGKDINTLEVWADHASKEIYVLPENGLRTEPANRGLGRFMLAMAARWTRKRFGNYQQRSVPLLVKHVANDSARFRRDYALQAQGFTVAYEDGVQMRANCSASRAAQVNTDWNVDKVRIIETGETADILQKADKTLKEQERELKKLNEQLEYLKKDDNTLRFTITMLVVFSIFQAILLIWMATR